MKNRQTVSAYPQLSRVLLVTARGGEHSRDKRKKLANVADSPATAATDVISALATDLRVPTHITGAVNVLWRYHASDRFTIHRELLLYMSDLIILSLV